MKKLYFFVTFMLLFVFLNVSAQKQALILGYSQANNIYEDENVKIELIRLNLKVTNKTDKTIYIDRKSSFYYINEKSFCLFEGKEYHGKNETTVEKDVDPIAPRGSKYIAGLKNPLGNRLYDAGGGNAGFNLLKKNKGAAANYLSDEDVEFMGMIETLRSELANNERKSSSSIHLTENESFMRIRVAINYSEDPKMDELKACNITSWISDLIMAKFFVRKQDKVVRSNAVNVKGRMLNTMHVFADSPFEYDEDISPLDGYTISFGKGKFYVHQFNNHNDDGIKHDKNDNEIVSSFEDVSKIGRQKTVFIWEGETFNWVQDFTDSYARYLQEDGMKAKDAFKEAKDAAKKANKEQRLKL